MALRESESHKVSLSRRGVFDVAAEHTDSPDPDDPRIKGSNYYDPEVHHTDAEYDDLGVVCPSHTTERKLVAKIDFRVIPVLSILYLLAFLDRYGRLSVYV